MYEIDAFMKKLKHETLKIRISETLGQVCHTDHLRKYVFSPPKMTKVNIIWILKIQSLGLLSYARKKKTKVSQSKYRAA